MRVDEDVMAIGKKTGGRTRGTPNKRTQDVMEKLEQLGCDPIEGMARIARQAEEEGDKVLAARMYTELAPYIAPKRKAIEQTIKSEWEGVTKDEMESQYRKAIMNLPREDWLLVLDSIEPGERRELLEQLKEGD